MTFVEQEHQRRPNRFFTDQSQCLDLDQDAAFANVCEKVSPNFLFNSMQFYFLYIVNLEAHLKKSRSRPTFIKDLERNSAIPAVLGDSSCEKCHLTGRNLEQI